MTWFVQLAGDESDLAALAQSLTDPEMSVAHDGQGYVLTSTQFESGDDATTVHNKAEQMVELLNGAARLALDATQSIGVGAVYRHRENGKREISVFVETIMRFRAISPTVTITHADGTAATFHPADPVKEWLAIAQSNNAAATVLRILASGTLDWANLYRVLELVEGDMGGVDAIADCGWATKRSLKTFKHSANSPSASGIEARHAKETTQPPPKPMTIAEARQFISAIVHAWFREKWNVT